MPFGHLDTLAPYHFPERQLGLGYGLGRRFCLGLVVDVIRGDIVHASDILICMLRELALAELALNEVLEQHINYRADGYS